MLYLCETETYITGHEAFWRTFNAIPNGIQRILLPFLYKRSFYTSIILVKVYFTIVLLQAFSM